MLDVNNQNHSMKSAMSLSIRRLETELDAADLRRDEIMKEFRSDQRSEHNKYVECEHHLISLWKNHNLDAEGTKWRTTISIGDICK